MIVDATNIPPRQRGAFVDMAVRRAAPYSDPGYGASWSGGRASIWYWSKAQIEPRIEEFRGKRISFVPEALHTGAIAVDEDQILALQHGFEGRIWRQGILLGSRWWPAPPTRSQWHDFSRGAGQGSDNEPPTPLDAPIASRRWQATAVMQDSRMSALHQYLPQAALAAGILIGGAFALQIGMTLRAGYDLWQAQRASRDVDEPLKRILQARERADAANAALTSLLALREGQPQYRLLAEAASVMKGKQWRMRLWQQPTPDRIEVTMNVSSPELEPLVSAWEASALFDKVTGELSRQQDEVILRASIVPEVRQAPVEQTTP